MINGIIQTENGFSVKDFDAEEVMFSIGCIRFRSYMDAVKTCKGIFYPLSYYHYLKMAAGLEGVPDADVWENMVYAGDSRGIYDGETDTWRNVTSIDRGAATEEEIAYIDALDSTYKSLVAMSGGGRITP